MTELQSKMLDLLIEFDELCRNHSIRYCVCSGCALGLERNGGFLPWDDDIDIFMEAEEFAKLDQLLNENLPEHRAWLTEQNYPGYKNVLPRYVDMTTTDIFRSRIGDESPMGLCLEIFVLDPYPNDRSRQLDYDKYLWLYTELLTTRFLVANAKRFTDIYDEDLFRAYQQRVRKEGKTAVLEDIKRNHLTYKKQECDYYCVRWGLQRVVLKKEWFEHIVYRKFEDVMLPFFAENIEYLAKAEYNYDWNIVPVENSRLTHPAFTSPEISYQKFEGEILKMSQRQKSGQALEENKGLNLERKFADLRIQAKVGLQKKAILEIYAQRIREDELVLTYDNLPHLRNILADYMKIQLNPRYNVTKIQAKVSDALLESLFYLLLYDNRIIKAKEVLASYSDWEKYPRYLSLTENFENLKMEKYKGNGKAVTEILAFLTANGFEYQIEVERSRLWNLLNQNPAITETELFEFYEKLKNQNDPEIKKYIGDFYYNKQDYYRSDPWYMEAKNTRNGMVLRDLREKGYF